VPTSNFFQINQIVQTIYHLKPNSLLDVGVGFGKYGFLAREYLELWDGRDDYDQWTRRIDGIEVFPDYLTPIHNIVYDNIYVGDALELVPALETHYDLVLLIDIIEHFTHDEGRRLLADCLRIGNNVLIATPKDITQQETTFSNPYERHRSQWQKWHFEKYEQQCQIDNTQSFIYLIGPGAAILDKKHPIIAR